MNLKNIYILTTLMLATACSDELNQTDLSENTGDICVTATVSGMATRASEGDNDGIVNVTDGTYTVTMSSEDCYECRFAEGEGRLYPEGSSVPIQWAIYTYESDYYYFWMDNILDRNNVVLGDNPKNYTFIGPIWTAEERKKYRAAQDTGEGENLVPCDIVWNTAKAEKGQKVNIDLLHRMARVNVILKDVGEYSDKNITVRLTDLILEPAAFNRIDGTVMLNSPEDNTGAGHEDLTLLDNAPLAVSEEDGALVGRTPSFILPPQKAREGEHICYLKVTIDGITYSAPLPLDMIHTPENVSDVTGFAQGLHLEIRARITTKDDQPKIEFGPVYVKRWEDVGNYFVPAVAGGVTNVNDLNTLIELYNKMPDKTGTQLNSYFDIQLLGSDYKHTFRKLTQFGRHTYEQTGYEGKMYWNFKLRNDIELSSAELQEKFNYNYYRGVYPFNIDFDGHKMIIDGVEYTSFEAVKNKLMVIPSEEDILQTIISQYNLLPSYEEEYTNLMSYNAASVYSVLGNYPSYKALLAKGGVPEWKQNEGKLYWTFTLEQDVTLPEGFEKFNFDYYYPFTINFNGHKITIGNREYTSFDEAEAVLVSGIPDGTTELQGIIEHYNALSDLTSLGDLTTYPFGNELISGIGYTHLKYLVDHGCSYIWVQAQGKLYLAFTLRQDATLPDGFTGFKKSHFENCYPFTITFNGHTINGRNTFDDDTKNWLITNP